MASEISVDQRAMAAVPGFTPDQARQLVELGLESEAQIKALKSALLGVHACLLVPAALTDVRNELTELQAELSTARSKLRHIRRSGSAAAWEAHLRMQQARAQYGDPADPERWGDDAQRAEKVISEVLEIVDRAIHDLPAKQRRARTANPEGVRHIHLGLLRGWTEVHRGVYAPAFPFKPSSNPTSAFRCIVGICYAAVTGNADADPERAIKAFIKQERIAAKMREAERAL